MKFIIYVLQAREHVRHRHHKRQFVGGLYFQKQYGVIVLPAHPSTSKSKLLKRISAEHRGRGDQRIHHFPVVGQQTLKRGQILVELIPSFYEITSFTNGQLRDVSSSDVTLSRVLHLTPENFGKYFYIGIYIKFFAENVILLIVQFYCKDTF